MADPFNDLSERVVMVARYWEKDGIARYAEQLAASHGTGRSFLRVGILEGPGDYHRTFHRGPRALWLLRDARRRDDILVHYHPHYFIKGGAFSQWLCHVSWALLGLLRNVTYVVHEPDPPRPAGAVEWARRRGWRRARRLVFHSDWERERHQRRFGAGRRQELVVVEHGDFFSAAARMTREEARRTLGLPPERTIVLMIGFISAAEPDKGYGRAIAAVQAADAASLLLFIVGSPIRQEPALDALLAELRDAARRSEQVELREGYVDDAEFDTWVCAADAVLTPYRTSSSSGVVARAHLLGTPVVMSNAGGLPAQAGPEDLVFETDAQLAGILRELGANRRPARR